MINYLVVEVTRRCNASCAHCLRGDAEPLDLKWEYANALFAQLARDSASIGCLTFSGGEPSLVPEILIGILDEAKKYDIWIGNFYIATNAVSVSDKFLIACIEWYCFCRDNEITEVQWSNDQYHSTSPEAVRRLQALGFAHAKYPESLPRGSLTFLREGRARALPEAERLPTESLSFEDDYLEGDLYLNAKGQLINGCDWSYESQQRHFLMNVSDFSMERLRNSLK